jgi:hypothetical protein
LAGKWENMKTRNFGKYFLVALVFGLLLAFYYFPDFDVTKHQFLTAALKVPSIKNYGGNSPAATIKVFSDFGWAIVLGFTLVSWLVSLILLLILKLVRLSKFKTANLIVLLLTYGAVLGLAVELLFYEKRYAVASLGIIYFVGQPLYSAAIGTLVFIALVFILGLAIRMFKKRKSPPIDTPPTSKVETAEEIKSVDKKPEAAGEPKPNSMAKFAVLLALPLLASGCNLIGGSEDLACLMSSDPHCYQNVAVSEGDADICAQVKQPAEFKSMGSNPPQDKCYLMEAQNTGDLSACDKIKGGLMSYTREECILEASVANQDASGCQKLSGTDKANCVNELQPLMTPDKVLEVDSQIEILQNELKNGSDPNLEKQLAGLQKKKDDMLAIMSKDNKDQYNIQKDPVNKQIIGDFAVGDIDSKTKNEMIDINEKLKSQGVTMTDEQYKAMRDHFKYINDPENNIETMDDSKIVKDRFGEKVGNLVDKLKFWKVKDTAEEKSEDVQLRFYQRMMERQEAIDRGMTTEEMNYENTVDKVAETVTEKVREKAKDKVIEEIFGEAAGKSQEAATLVLGEAINEVKKQAQSAEFRGLVKAYDDGMAEELGKVGGNVDRAHEIVIKKLSEDPYAYASGDSFAKYGNLIANPECDGSNPLCLKKDIFWKAMKKSYKYQNQQS